MGDLTPHHDGLDANPRPIRVSSTSVIKSVAGSIAHRVREYGYAEVDAVGFNFVCTPQFIDVAIQDQERTAFALLPNGDLEVICPQPAVD